MAACFIYPNTIMDTTVLDVVHKNQPVNIDNVIYISKDEEYNKEFKNQIYKIIFKFRDGGRLEWQYLSETKRDDDLDRDQLYDNN